MSVHIASSVLCVAAFSLFLSPLYFLSLCSSAFFPFSFGHPSLSHSQWLSPALVDSRDLSSIFLSYSPHEPNPSIPHPHPIFTARLRFDHLNPLILILSLIIYSLTSLLHSIIYIIISSFFAATHRQNSKFVLLLALLADLI